MSHQSEQRRGSGVIRWASCVVGVWACLSTFSASAHAQGSCDEASAKPLAACLELGRARLSAFETRDSGLTLMRWICRSAESKDQAVACLEYGEAHSASLDWNGATREATRAYQQGCARGHVPSCAARAQSRYSDTSRDAHDVRFWGNEKASTMTHAQELARLKSQCEAGDARSCVVQGVYISMGSGPSKSKTTFAPTKTPVDADVDAVLALFERACDAGERLGCYEHAQALLALDLDIPGALVDAQKSFSRMCRGKDRRGCGELARMLNKEGVASSHRSRIDHASRGCDQGHMPDCVAWANEAGKEAPVEPYERLCQLQAETLSCAVASLAYDKGHMGVTKVDLVRSVQLAKQGCSADTALVGDLSYYDFNCTRAAEQSAKTGSHNAAIMYQKRACAAGVARACDDVIESRIVRDTAACVNKTSHKACTSAISLTHSTFLEKSKATRDVKAKQKLRQDTTSLFSKLYGVSCTRWKDPYGCAISAIMTEIRWFQMDHAKCTRQGGEACDHTLVRYANLRSQANASDFGDELELLTGFGLKGWRTMADSRCSGGSGSACYMRGMDHLGSLSVGKTDEARARASFESGCKLGSGDACGVLAAQLQEGRGGAPDKVRARAVAKEGCEAGSKVACRASQKLTRALEGDRARIERLDVLAGRARDEAGAANTVAVFTGLGIAVGVSAVLGGMVHAVVNSSGPEGDEFPVVGVGLIVGGAALGALSGPALGNALDESARANKRAEELESKLKAERRRAGLLSLQVVPTLTRSGENLVPGASLSARF